MSESTSAPESAPAPAPAPAPAQPALDRGPPIAPPAAGQPGISVSEAARLLSKQRRQAGEAAPAPSTPERRPSANEMLARAAETPVQPAQLAQPKAPAGASALEKALGVPAAPQTAPETDGATIELEGQRYSPAQLREAVLKAHDYTRKTQELAERGRHLEAQQQALAAVLPYIQPELAKLAEIVQRTPQRPDPAMADQDPARYIRERAAYESAMEEQQRLGNLTTLQQQAHQRAMEQQVAAANEQLARDMPSWADPQQRRALQQEILTWATTKGGFSERELQGLTSPHHLMAMMKAAAYDNMVAGARTTAPPIRMAAPVRGAPPPPPASERIQVAEQTFEAKPNVRNAAALLSARRSGQR